VLLTILSLGVLPAAVKDARSEQFISELAQVAGGLPLELAVRKRSPEVLAEGIRRVKGMGEAGAVLRKGGSDGRRTAGISRRLLIHN